MGIRCCQRVSEPKRPLLPYLSAVLGTNEVNTLEMASAYGTLATGGQHVNPVPVISIADADGSSRVAGEPEATAGHRPGRRRGRERHPAEGRALRDGDGREHRSAADRQDRHEPELRGRLVRRGRSRSSSPRSGWGSRRGRSRCTAGSPGSRCSAGRGRHRSGACSWSGRSSTCPCEAVPDARRELRGRRGRRDAEPVLPAEPVHAAPEHPDAGVHRGDGADADMHGAHVVAGDPGAIRGGALAGRSDDDPRRRRAST